MQADFVVPQTPMPARETHVFVHADGRRNLRECVAQLLPGAKCLFVGDRDVLALWSEDLGLHEDEVLALPPGEAAKTPTVLMDTCRSIARHNLARGDVLVSIGGGSCGDLVGMAASVYMRGIAVAHVPTTLVAMVDASLGGKCAIDIPEGKNLLGTFWSPRFLLVDPQFLTTLPPVELRAGFGEVAKYGLGFDAELFALLEQHVTEDAPIIDVARRCLAIKARVVRDDMYEDESGARVLLNLGHTTAHAIESLCLERGRIAPHGLAVGYGLRVASRLAQSRSMIEPSDYERIDSLLNGLAMPTSATELCTIDPSIAELRPFLLRDKKRRGAQLRAVLPRGIGNCELLDFEVNEFAAAIVATGRD